MNHNDVIFHKEKKDPRDFAYQCKALIENCQQAYDAENRLVGVSGAEEATFYYDGDGNRVKKTIGGVTTTYIGDHFEWTGSTSDMKKTYYAEATRVVVRTGASTINYLLGYHPSLPLGTSLGSTAITTDSSGVKSAEIRYYPWGTERYACGLHFDEHAQTLAHDGMIVHQQHTDLLAWRCDRRRL